MIRVPSPTEAVTRAPAPDRRLVEKTRHGVLPRIGADGSRPADDLCPPRCLPASRRDAPRIAILVGGLGLSQSVTADAVTKLPGAVTLAFAPMATELDRQAARARDDGHEVMLQVPMEPFDYPDNDPGAAHPAAAAHPADNLDKLHWSMSRFPGYTGIVNYMGARFTSTEAALRRSSRTPPTAA